MDTNRSTPPEQRALVVLEDNNGEILLSCGRRYTEKSRNDSVFLVAHLKDADDVRISLKMREADEFFELLMLLVSDANDRPFAGRLSASTVVGDGGGVMEISVAHHESYIAHVTLTGPSGHPGAAFDADRFALDRFLHCAVQGLCDEIKEDD